MTTTFVDDATVVKTTFPIATSGVSGLSVSPVAEPSIRSFLAKPYLAASYAWSATDTSNTAIMTYTTLNVGGITIFAQKLAGYQLWRGTLVAKLVINAQPFQAGRLLMHVLPFVNASPSYYANSHNIDLCQKTQHPSVELDCRDTSAEIELPWVGPTPWSRVDLSTTVDWGTIYVDVLSPLLTGTSGSTNVEVQLFLSIKDAEFAAPIVPQSGDATSVKRMSRRKQKLSTDTESEALSEGKPISTALKLAARCAEVASGIPLLSSIAAPAAWVLNASAGLASSFGWSKPNLTNAPNFVVLRPFHNFGNSSGTSQAEPLAITADPMVSILPGFGGTDLDEMSWNYIKSIPAFVERFSFTTSNAVGDTVYTKAVGPNKLYNSYSNGLASPNTAVYRTFPPFSYVANVFAKFRGGIKIILKFVKTDYHSGRLLITWSPRYNGLAVTPSVATSAYSMRTIVDLREVTEVEMTLPYMLDSAWQQFDLDMGTLTIKVLNLLQAPATVGASVDTLVYYCAAEDFDVALPNSVAYQPYTPQSGDKPNTKAIGIIGNDTSTIPMVEEFSIGERFTSVKQMISRYSRIYFTSVTADTCVGMRMYPWAVGMVTGSPAITTGAMMGDMYSYFAPGFALARGGMRYAINTANSVWSQVDFSRNVFDLMEAGGSPYTVQYAGTTLATGFANGSAAISNLWVKPAANLSTGTINTANPAIFVQSTNGVEVLIPQFSNNPSRLIVYDVGPNQTSANYPFYAVPRTALCWQEISSTVTNKAVYRAAAEDAQLGYFIGFPASLISIS